MPAPRPSRCSSPSAPSGKRLARLTADAGGKGEAARQDEHEIAYLFADGIAERLHGGQRREAVLCAWGITIEGQQVLLHLSPGTKEDTESCRAFFQDSTKLEATPRAEGRFRLSSFLTLRGLTLRSRLEKMADTWEAVAWTRRP